MTFIDRFLRQKTVKCKMILRVERARKSTTGTSVRRCIRSGGLSVGILLVKRHFYDIF